MKVLHSFPLPVSIKNPVVTLGTFDGVHTGHVKILEKVKTRALQINGQSVVITFNPHPRQVLFPHDDSLRLLNSTEEKIENFEKLGIDFLIILEFTKEFSRLTAMEFVRDILVNEIGIKELIIGYDHHFGRNREGSIENLREMAKTFEFEVEEIPAELIDEITVSSTKIRKAITEGDIKTANSFLGHPFRFSGKVEHGQKLGRTLGFPTANLVISHKYKIIPGNGVYAVKINCNFLTLSGVMNIGYRPTIGSFDALRIEVHIFDFNEDIYGKELTVTVLDKLRDEKKFKDIVELKEQIGRDIEKARDILKHAE